MHSETDRTYLAALIDGEGHIGIALAKPRTNRAFMRTHSAILTVANTYLPVMDEIREDWGGTLVVRKANPTSSTMIGNLRWSSKAAAEVLWEIRPYMRIKHAQADLLLAFADELAARPSRTQMISKDEWDRREDLRVSIRQLNKPDPSVVAAPYPTNPALTCAFCGDQYTNYVSTKSMYCGQKCAQKARWQRVKSATA